MFFGFALLALILLIGWLKRTTLRARMRQLVKDVASLKEKNAALSAKADVLQQGYEDMRTLAAGAIEAARSYRTAEVESDKRASSFEERLASQQRSQSDYIPPEVKNCPKCAVSVRASEWPQKCPACAYLFGDILDADVIE